MNISRISKLLLVIAIVVLISGALAISRDYQDSWILEGLEIPFVFFVIAYSIAFFSERRTPWMVILAIIGRTVFLLIPNLKYVWFQGAYVDQHRQYALANHVYNEGHISTESDFSVYTSTPLIHLSFSTFSIILNLPVVDSLKYLPVLFSPIYPLLTYAIMNRIEFSRGTNVLKYALFISSVPFSFGDYVVTGSLFGILLAFLILHTLISMFKKSDRRYWVVCTIFMIALTTAHSVTSMIFTVFLLAIMSLQRVLHFPPISYLRASVAFTFASTSAAWLLFQGGRALDLILGQIFVSVPSGTTPASEHIPFSFFEHVRVNLLSAIKSFSVFYGADAILLLLMLGGLIILLKMRKKLSSVAKFLLLFGWLTFLLMIIGVLLRLGAPRALQYARLLFPVFSSLLILHISKHARIKKWIRPVMFLSIMLLAPIELYRCQPLISSANVLYKDLPPDVPLSYVNMVNSIYQRQMIDFAENHARGRIACDLITRNQIIGLTRINFSVAHLVRHYPCYYPLDKSQPELGYDYFLIHLPGKSGPFGENPQIRTPSLILEAIYNSSIVYTNGESYILAKSFSD